MFGATLVFNPKAKTVVKMVEIFSLCLSVLVVFSRRGNSVLSTRDNPLGIIFSNFNRSFIVKFSTSFMLNFSALEVFKLI